MSVSGVTIAVVVGTGGHSHHLSPFSQWKQRQLGRDKESKMKAMAGVTGTLKSLFQQAKMHSAVLSYPLVYATEFLPGFIIIFFLFF